MSEFVFVETDSTSSSVSSYQISASSPLLQYSTAIKCSSNNSNISFKHIGDSISRALASTLLPSGYPGSVRSEYLEYQCWDCLQGVSSSLRSVLTTRSVLRAVGVGSADVSPISATLVWVVKDGLGMIGSLVFAYLYADTFEMYTKEFRLLADVFNNVALAIDAVSGLFPEFFLLSASVSTICKSCCGLLAGCTKSRISAHFCKSKGSLADVTAKESTQEIAVGLFGLVVGMLLVRILSTDWLSSDNSNSNECRVESGISYSSSDSVDCSKDSAYTSHTSSYNDCSSSSEDNGCFLSFSTGRSNNSYNSSYIWSLICSLTWSFYLYRELFLFVLLTILHQYSNYRLVRVLVLESLNPQRAFLIAQLDYRSTRTLHGGIGNILPDSTRTSTSMSLSLSAPAQLPQLPLPSNAHAEETLFRPFYLSFRGPLLGASMATLLAGLRASDSDSSSNSTITTNNNTNNTSSSSTTNNNNSSSSQLQRLCAVWKGKPFLIALDVNSRVVVCLEEACPDNAIQEAFLLACWLHVHLCDTHHHQHKKQQHHHIHTQQQQQQQTLLLDSAKLAMVWYDTRLKPLIATTQQHQHPAAMAATTTATAAAAAATATTATSIATDEENKWDFSPHTVEQLLRPLPYRYKRLSSAEAYEAVRGDEGNGTWRDIGVDVQ